MSHNSHVADFWYHCALIAMEHRRWMAYEFFRQWHQDELELASNPVYPVA